MAGKYGSFVCFRFLDHMKNIDPNKYIIDIVMFNGASNVQLWGDLLKINNPKLTVIYWVEHNVAIYFNDVSKLPIVNQIIWSHKAIYNIHEFVIYNSPHSIFKPKSFEYYNRNICLFSGNDTRMAGNFVEIHRNLYMRKIPVAKIP